MLRWRAKFRRVHDLSYPAICDKDLCQGPAVARRLAAHGLNGVHRRAWSTGGSGKDGCEPGGMKCRHDGGPMKSGQWGLFYSRTGAATLRRPSRKRGDDVRNGDVLERDRRDGVGSGRLNTIKSLSVPH